MSSLTQPGRPTGLSGLVYRPEVRRVAYQVLVLGAVVFAAYLVVSNVAENLRRQNIVAGLDFLGEKAGFDISQTLIEYSAASSTYGRAFLVGLLNTLLVAALGIVAATAIGFVVGIARLSSNWLIAKLAAAYVEVVRNLPLLLQLFFWYAAVLQGLPGPRNAYALPGGAYFSVRGLNLPAPVAQPGLEAVALAFAAGAAVAAAVWWWARRRQALTGQRFPAFWTGLLAIVGLPLATFFLAGRPLRMDYPELQGFNFQGGIAVLPELIALLLGLSFYTASFIAEIVRAGILGVSKGQSEAAQALGLTRGQTLRLVVIPQAARIIIPPLTSQYLNLTKNSSLAVAIGYPDLVGVFAGTVLNQTNKHAVEVLLITMGVFLTLSLLTSLFMNWFNRRMAIVER
jgi:general L-amino acid transport system permease protein